MKLEFGTGSSFAKLGKNKASLLVNHAIDLGISRFDTGVNYGNWKSQPLLGLVLQKHIKRNREKLIITSKAGTDFRSSKNFSPIYIEQMINKSISDMKCSYLDKFYLHGPSLKDIENENLIDKLKNLVQKGKIKQFGVNTDDLAVMEKIAKGHFKDISLLMIDYNLLQQERSKIFADCKKNNIAISCGTTLCQGALLQSPLESFMTKRNTFYLVRFVLKKSSRKYLSSAKIYREYAKRHFPEEYNAIPLSFVLNNSLINTIPIGMLSKSSIEKNINIVKKPINENITKEVGEWCISNCQILNLKN